MFHKKVYEYWKKRNHTCEKRVKSMMCSLYRLNFQYYLQVIKEHKYHKSKYPQLILCMLYRESIPEETYRNPQSSSRMVMTLKRCCLGSDVDYLFNPVFRHTLWHPRGGTEMLLLFSLFIYLLSYKAFRAHVKETMSARGHFIISGSPAYRKLIWTD